MSYRRIYNLPIPKVTATGGTAARLPPAVLVAFMTIVAIDSETSLWKKKERERHQRGYHTSILYLVVDLRKASNGASKLKKNMSVSKVSYRNLLQSPQLYLSVTGGSLNAMWPFNPTPNWNRVFWVFSVDHMAANDYPKPPYAVSIPPSLFMFVAMLVRSEGSGRKTLSSQLSCLEIECWSDNLYHYYCSNRMSYLVAAPYWSYRTALDICNLFHSWSVRAPS